MKKLFTTLFLLTMIGSLCTAQHDPLPDFLDLFQEHQEMKPVEKVFFAPR